MHHVQHKDRTKALKKFYGGNPTVVYTDDANHSPKIPMLLVLTSESE